MFQRFHFELSLDGALPLFAESKPQLALLSAWKAKLVCREDKDSKLHQDRRGHLRLASNTLLYTTHVTQKGWNVPTEGPETDTEVLRNEKARKNSKSELLHNRLDDDHTGQAYDRYRFQYFFSGCQKKKRFPFRTLFMFCYLDQCEISEDEIGSNIITRRVDGPKVSTSLKLFPKSVP